MSPLVKRTLHVAGGVLAVTGILFVLMRLWSYGTEINLALFDWRTWATVAILALAYGASNLMLALAWRNLLKHFGVVVTGLWATWAYGISQIAKYVPGNIFHLAGRQVLGASAGLPHWTLAKSALWELGLIATTGSLFGFLALPLLMGSASATASLMLFAVVLAVVATAMRKALSQAITMAFLWYVIFLLFSGGVFASLVDLLSQSDSIKIDYFIAMIGAYVIAWLAGFLTPGAPAGIGIRELVLVLLLQGVVEDAVLVLAVLLGRAVSAIGDTVFFLGAASIGVCFKKSGHIFHK